MGNSCWMKNINYGVGKMRGRKEDYTLVNALKTHLSWQNLYPFFNHENNVPTLDSTVCPRRPDPFRKININRNTNRFFVVIKKKKKSLQSITMLFFLSSRLASQCEKISIFIVRDSCPTVPDAQKLTGPEYPGTNPRSTSFSFEQGQAALGSEVTDK